MKPCKKMTIREMKETVIKVNLSVYELGIIRNALNQYAQAQSNEADDILTLIEYSPYSEEYKEKLERDMEACDRREAKAREVSHKLYHILNTLEAFEP